MRLFILISFCLFSLSAQTQNINNNCEEYQDFFYKKRIESELKTILHKIKLYKKEKNRELITLRKKIISLKSKFANYKTKKEIEIKKLKKRASTNPSILANKNQKIKKLEKELALMKKKLKQNRKTIIALKQKLIQKNQQLAVVPSTPPIVTQNNNHSPKKWIKITVSNDLNIYDLALKYYGDSQEYEKIYMANQNKIDKDYQIRNGMSLKIPITENFIEQQSTF